MVVAAVIADMIMKAAEIIKDQQMKEILYHLPLSTNTQTAAIATAIITTAHTIERARLAGIAITVQLEQHHQSTLITNQILIQIITQQQHLHLH